MKRAFIFGLILMLAVSVFSACGGGGGGDGADPNAPARVTLTTSKAMALANGVDLVTIQATVEKADGTAVADGTVVTFSVNTATLSASTAATTNGITSLSMTCAPIAGANNYTATVTASAGDVSGNTPVKFINQPTSVDVSIGFKQPIANLAALQFKLNNTAGAAFNNTDPQLVSAINAATGSTVVGNNVSGSNSTTIGLINAGGFNTGTVPIVKATFVVAAGAGLPAFSIDATPGNITSEPAVTADNLSVTVSFDTER
jgi:hypothetical protein